jgi:hypothetical protein
MNLGEALVDSASPFVSLVRPSQFGQNAEGFFGSLGITVGYPNILWSLNQDHLKEHPRDDTH